MRSNEKDIGDYKQIFNKMTSLGPNVVKQPFGTKGMNWSVEAEYNSLKKTLGVVKDDTIAKGCPDISDARQAAEAVLTLSSTSNGKGHSLHS